MPLNEASFRRSINSVFFSCFPFPSFLFFSSFLISFYESGVVLYLSGRVLYQRIIDQAVGRIRGPHRPEGEGEEQDGNTESIPLNEETSHRGNLSTRKPLKTGNLSTRKPLNKETSQRGKETKSSCNRGLNSLDKDILINPIKDSALWTSSS